MSLEVPQGPLCRGLRGPGLWQLAPGHTAQWQGQGNCEKHISEASDLALNLVPGARRASGRSGSSLWHSQPGAGWGEETRQWLGRPLWLVRSRRGLRRIWGDSVQGGGMRTAGATALRWEQAPVLRAPRRGAESWQAEQAQPPPVCLRPQRRLLRKALPDHPATRTPSPSTCFLSLAALLSPDSFTFICFLFLLLDWQRHEGQGLGCG